ncbi:AbrB/MazE/SpoVT family DNA-binding domain-containing protein [Listeria innocua]|uniref:type II toxin-antitoxin system PemI/MazE family antitoxin n=1 Tax=Listeria TaxID=1637 RepID=UPI0011EB99F3|nr:MULTISPECIES: AbrB/MazE/SpoVT family DNA-binding domain-containing protein [Listeria]EHK4067717.1 AbrB/MazE/SpoVT family DNA-binding domain-containing protein [Listeria monocytogenes]MBC1339364.1 AbrB/MazE/SpoVT family DNA-binding domain-containing protein [Listeria innocua]MBC1353547.1 AbrB/MazE/SpoVT family DNA-binding domain-containing protein [Listeria innocua]TYV33128.1 AbrB/MazE/SpoVT family DNA-binding domain-containing protein [Listeria monocytogenes]HAO6015899.1 AbrB/MazE/SpoVT fam
MLETKLRKQGNALMITIPASLKQKGRQIRHVVQEADGSIRLVPKRNNIYQNVEIGAYEQVEEWTDDLLHGREMI